MTISSMTIEQRIHQILMLLDEPEVNPDVSRPILAFTLMEHLESPEEITSRPLLGSLLMDLLGNLRGKLIGYIRNSKELVIELVRALTNAPIIEQTN